MKGQDNFEWDRVIRSLTSATIKYQSELWFFHVMSSQHQIFYVVPTALLVKTMEFPDL